MTTAAALARWFMLTASWAVSRVVWALRWHFPEADPELAIPVWVIVKEVPPENGKRNQGREGSQAGVSPPAKT